MMSAYREPLRVLIADDQPQVRSALRFLIENQEEHWNIAGEVVDYPGLLAALQRGHTDLILLDWELPGLAEQPSDQLTRLRSGRAVVVVAISGYSEARQQADAAGVDAFISKTDPPDRFLEVLKTAGRLRT